MCILKILESMPEFGGLWKHQTNPACAKCMKVFKTFKTDTIRKQKEAEEELSVPAISENVFLSQTCFTEYSHTQTVFQKRKRNHSTDTLYLFKMYSNQLKNVEPGSISLFSEMHERCAGTCVSIHGTA